MTGPAAHPACHPLRRLAIGDMDAAADVLRRALDGRLPWLAGMHTPAQDRAFMRDHVLATCEIWGAGTGPLAGMIAFRDGWVDQLHVRPEWQGRGLGSALLDLAKARSRRLHLWTFQRNHAARRFYRSRGFVQVDATDGSRNPEREPDVLYRWDAAA